MKYEPFAIERLQDILKIGFKMHEETDFQVVPLDIEQSANSI